MSLALHDELSCSEVVEADHTCAATDSEVLIGVGDGHGCQFISLTSVRARFKQSLRGCLSQIPIGNLLLLANADVFVIIERCDCEGIKTPHALRLRRDSLLSLEVPAEDRLVTSTRQQVLVVSKEQDFAHAARVLLQVRNELARADLPDTDLTLQATRANKFAALSEADRCDATLMSVVNLPEQLAVVHTVGSDLSIVPSADDHFISKNGTEWE